ncbi:MAG: hypothetical protein HC887_05275 [Desulfobacteraceae bacterium]|nr:hypothetical protein [Desulfobacteraceae bacterium]
MSDSTIFSFYGFEDKDSNTTCTPITEEPSFQMDFPAGERVWTSAFASAGQIYFGTTTADTEDPCDGYGGTTSKASSNVYVLGKNDSGEMQLVHTISDTPNMNVPPVVDDGHLYIRGPDGKIKSYGSDKYNNAQNIYGIAQPPKQKTWREVY